MGEEKEGSALEEQYGYTVPAEAVEGHGSCLSVNGTVNLSLCTSIMINLSLCTSIMKERNREEDWTMKSGHCKGILSRVGLSFPFLLLKIQFCYCNFPEGSFLKVPWEAVDT